MRCGVRRYGVFKRSQALHVVGRQLGANAAVLASTGVPYCWKEVAGIRVFSLIVAVAACERGSCIIIIFYVVILVILF